LETKGAIFAHFVRSAELIEEECDRYSPESRLCKVGIAGSVEHSGWANWVEVKLPGVHVAAGGRQGCAIFYSHKLLSHASKEAERFGVSRFEFFSSLDLAMEISATGMR
jgi:hypothetical protein